ncbi:MAG TPA: sigma-70 family RNA polymerase sigma factor [Solirubrobacterales bacterium]|nr:sigma-70 family RNA polymerase sigma factor [Solirubrobacterales bacterium]
MPPPAEELIPRLFLGPALRAQPDRRLVKLVRDGYENAFEEIVRRYGDPLRRYAWAIVGGHAEDVTQDAFSKALLAMRRDDGEIELRPWLYRIVRNTALNDLRDRPPSPQALEEAIAGGRSAAEEVERREDVAELMARLRALPEQQRAAIVMRELEGLGHEEIAAALGVSGGAARQAIYRARRALRDGLGLLLPLPLLKALLAAGTAEAATGAVAGAAGAGIAVKATAATVLVAGTIGTGVALNHERVADGSRAPAPTPVTTVDDSSSGSSPAPFVESDDSSGRGSGGSSGEGSGNDDRSGHRGASSGSSGSGSSGTSGSGSSGSGSSGSGSSGSDDD